MREALTHASYSSVSKHDTDDACVHEELGQDRWEHRYHQLSATRFRGHFTQAGLGPVHLLYEEVSGSFRYTGRSWKGSWTFVLPLAGTGEFRCNRRQVAAGACAVYRWDSLESLTCNSGFKGILVTLDERLLQRYAEKTLQRTALDRCPSFLINSNPSATADLQLRVLDALGCLSHSPPRTEAERDSIRAGVLGAVIEVLDASRTAARLPSPSTRSYVVDKAMQYMDSRLAAPIALADLCEVVGVCPRTLRYSFQEVLGVSPTRYLLARRLAQVRRELHAATACVMIEEVAVRFGFWHLGRFAQFYRHTFGERPSDTRQRALSAARQRSG